MMIWSKLSDPMYGPVNEAEVDICLDAVQDVSLSDDERGMMAVFLGPSLELASWVVNWDNPHDTEGVPFDQAKFEEIRSVLRTTFDDPHQPDLVRQRVFQALVRDPQDWHEDAIEKAWASEDVDWRQTALFGMAYFARFSPTILAALDDSDLNIVLQAVRSVDVQALTEAAPQLHNLAQTSSNEEVRIAAIYALVDAGNSETMRVLGELMEDPDEEISSAAEAAFNDHIQVHECIEGECF